MDSEVKAPALLLAIGTATIVASAFLRSGVEDAAITMLTVLVVTVASVLVGIVALLISAAISGATYGLLPTAMLKLAAIYTFPGALAILAPDPILAWLLSVVLYLGLVKWLFDLDGWELVITVVVMFVVRLVVQATIAGALMAALG